MMMGIFLAFNSFIAICRGSVSPSNSTMTGAFILNDNKFFFLNSKVLQKPVYQGCPNCGPPADLKWPANDFNMISICKK